MSTCNFTTTASSIIGPDINQLNIHHLRPLEHSSLEILSCSSISEISNSKISNSTIYDPGITAVNCHYSPISKFSIMEEDCQDCTSSNLVSTKNEDPPDLNQFLSQIATQVMTATDKMSSDFHHVMSNNRIFKQEVMEANDVFKEEVRGELQELRSLIRQWGSEPTYVVVLADARCAIFHPLC
jgi:hypothetical protein